eukprot:CAMPEP_0183732160 /NCGR_PEP_ID=MMETSP0737-20130205/37682_1 /TAXON_ID=385413 /ORGANISM="Thalassiosira miniscula, Strain CCMP1093" /LENGTH=128 /DNA_ID=CAMNT_0025965089 /DNA_START=77 /DNA_END=463 /DNA_ORIENTATION=-
MASGQIAHVARPKRARNTNTVVDKQSLNQGSTSFGRRTRNLRSNNNIDWQHRELPDMSMSMPSETEEDTPVTTPASAPAPTPVVVEEPSNCSESADCGEGKYCACRWNCRLCSDVTVLRFDSLCGICV